MADQHIGQVATAINAPGSNFYGVGFSAPADWPQLRQRFYQHLLSRCQELSAAKAAVLGTDRAATRAERIPTQLCYLEPHVADARDQSKVERLEHEAAQPKPLSQALAMRPKSPQRFLLVGAGGMGKTTTLNHLVLQRLMNDADQTQPPPLLLLRLPFLASFLPDAVTPLDKPAALRLFEKAVAADIREALGDGCQEIAPATLAHELLQEMKLGAQGLFLLDALDEVDPQRRMALVGLVCRAVDEWAAPAQQHLVVLTGRPYAFDDQALARTLADAHFSRLELQALNPQEQAEFVRLHFAAAEGLPPDRLPDFVLPQQAQHLLQRLGEPTLQDLAQTPLVLFLMCILAQQGEGADGLPSSRALLLDRVVTLWQQQWDPARSVHERLSPSAVQALVAHKQAIRQALAAAAARAYAADPDWQDMPETGCPVLWESLVTALDKRLPDDFPVRAHVIARLLKDRSSLVDQDGDGDLAKLRFPHNYFKELLAVQHLWDDCQQQAIPFAQAIAQRVQAAPVAFQAWARTALDWLVQHSPDPATRQAALGQLHKGLPTGAALSAACPSLEEGGAVPPKLAQHAQAWVVLAEGLQRSGPAPEEQAPWRDALNALAWRGGLPPTWRDRAANELAAWQALSDARFAFNPPRWQLPSRRARVLDGQTWRDATPHEEPLPGFVRVEGGRFVRGEKGESDNPPCPIELPTFYMARTLTTVAQWQCFVHAQGYDDPQWWTEPQAWAWRQGQFDSQIENKQYRDWLAGRPKELRHQPGRWAEQVGQPQKPVWGVNWFEARAYARWLTAQLQADLGAAGLVGWQVRLPTEDQTERAQRAASLAQADTRRFSWGDEEAQAAQQANFDKTGLGHASPVGLFAANPLGLFDLTGNLWAWQDNLYQSKATKALWPRITENQTLKTHKDLEQCELPALRGGSWVYPSGLLRCEYRDWIHFGGNNFVIGVRLVLSLVP
ncbi:MAG: SUMF1/EgtB/PvdO family nonheme iron enzyme [Ideonella sp.]|nr:SUMF1/EgtB/PvdO family nonheme iron enzyme [Ideonella sp.]